MREIAIRDALKEAMTEEMVRDERVFLMGEEVGAYNGAYKCSKGMLDQFGPKRVIDAPIAECGFSGVGIGAAMCGLRPRRGRRGLSAGRPAREFFRSFLCLYPRPRCSRPLYPVRYEGPPKEFDPRR